MRIIINELKKIFNVTNVLVLLVASFLIWNLFIYFEIEYFPNGQPHTQHYNNAVTMLNRYGTSMDEKEYEDYKKIREDKEKEATNYLLNDKDARSLEISTYDELRAIIQKENRTAGEKKIDDLYSKIMFEENIGVFWDLEAIDYEMGRYEDKKFWVGLGQQGMNENVLERQREVINSEQVNSPLNFVILRNYNNLILSVTTLILISVAIMISPIFSNDNRNKVNYLQYSSKVGRKLFKKKIIAGVISSLVIVTMQLGIFFTIYKSNNTLMFWDCSINSVFSDALSWFDLTFGQYIMLSVIITYIVALGYSAIVMFVSSKVNSYIALIGIQIPILFVLQPALSDIMDIMALGTSVYVPKYTLPIILVIVGVVGVGLMILAYRKECNKDIKN